MKKWSLGLLLCIFCACTDQLDDTPVIPEDTDAYISLTVQVPGVNVPKTYAGLTEMRENEINHIDILAFIEEDGKEIFSYRVTVPGRDIQDAEGSVDGNRKVIDLKVKRQHPAVKLMIVANAYSALNAINSAGNLVEGETTKDQLRELLTFNGTYWRSDNLTKFEGFPMWGETSRFIAFDTEATTVKESVSLLRAVAKIDIGADIYGDPALGFGSRFEIKQVLVYRANMTGKIVPNSGTIVENIANQPSVPTGVEQEDEALKFIYDEDDKAEAMMKSKIYLAEAEACKTGYETSATCLVIGAHFDGGPLTYYRVDFIDKEGDYLPLLRNHYYIVNITSIAGDGYSNPDDAAGSKSSSLLYDIEVTDEHINDIVYNNEYMLGVNKSLLYADWKVDSYVDLVVSTDYIGDWTARLTFNSVSVDWIGMKLQGEGGNTEPTDRLTVKGDGTKKTIRLVVAKQNREKSLRGATITLTAGSLTTDVVIRQRMGSNSYITKPNGSVEIPVAFANADGIERIGFDVQVQPILLWTDNLNTIYSIQKSSVIGDATIFTVNTGNVAGNAVIGAQVGGQTVWSWHVWVTDYEPEDNIRYNNGYTFMDRNLGALSKSTTGMDAYGLLYQWGRKDPFPHAYMGMYDGGGNAMAFEAQPVTEPDNLENAIANPTIFYTSSGAPYYSWQGTSTSSNFLWSDADGNKTPYDPCPDGWRVPVSGTGSLSPWYGAALADLVDNRAPGYYPLAGGRMYDTGEPGDTGVRGYAWAASPYSFNGFLFQYGAGAINPEGSGYRANGYPVRCVKE